MLDPTIKYTYFDGWDPEWRPNLKLAMRSFWEKTYRSSTGLIQPDSLATVLESENKFMEWMQKKKSGNWDTDDELDRYLSEPLLLGNNGSAIERWTKPEQRPRWRLISSHTPSMSSEPNRVFSGANYTVTE